MTMVASGVFAQYTPESTESTTAAKTITALTAGTITASSTLAVTGVATFTAAPKLTAVTAGGSATATMTNAPAITEETPIWINITVGTNDYVFAAWLKD